MPEETTPKSTDPQKAKPAKSNKEPNREQSEELPNPTAGESKTPSASKAHAPSTDEPQATDLPTGSGTAPDPDEVSAKVNPNAAAEKNSGASAPKKAAAQGAAAKAASKKPKKEVAPGVEDKPFAEFIQQDFLPALQKAFATENIQDLQLTLENSQVTGRWNDGQRQFTVYFPEENIQGRKAFSCANYSTTPSTIEPFLIDERKITLDLLVFGVIQRLNAQKWFGNN